MIYSCVEDSYENTDKMMIYVDFTPSIQTLTLNY